MGESWTESLWQPQSKAKRTWTQHWQIIRLLSLDTTSPGSQPCTAFPVQLTARVSFLAVDCLQTCDLTPAATTSHTCCLQSVGGACLIASRSVSSWLLFASHSACPVALFRRQRANPSDSIDMENRAVVVEPPQRRCPRKYSCLRHKTRGFFDCCKKGSVLTAWLVVSVSFYTSNIFFYAIAPL